jgi:predicted enzyme related to lactoylglutathione lyase
MKERDTVAKPAVVQFEVTGKDSADLKRFYAILFGWEMHESPITPGYYRVGADEPGIPGGIGPSQDGGAGWVTFFVEVDDLQEHLSRAEELGGTIVRPPKEVPQAGLTFAFVADFEGHVVGLTHGLRRV